MAGSSPDLCSYMGQILQPIVLTHGIFFTVFITNETIDLLIVLVKRQFPRQEKKTTT